MGVRYCIRWKEHVIITKKTKDTSTTKSYLLVPLQVRKKSGFFFETSVTQERSSQALQLLSTEKDYRKERMNKKFKFEINHKVVQISLPQHSKSSVAIALICSWRKIVSFVFVKII